MLWGLSLRCGLRGAHNQPWGWEARDAWRSNGSVPGGRGLPNNNGASFLHGGPPRRKSHVTRSEEGSSCEEGRGEEGRSREEGGSREEVRFEGVLRRSEEGCPGQEGRSREKGCQEEVSERFLGVLSVVRQTPSNGTASFPQGRAVPFSFRGGNDRHASFGAQCGYSALGMGAWMSARGSPLPRP